MKHLFKLVQLSFLLMIMAFLGLFTSCQKDDLANQTSSTPGTLISYEYIKTVSTTEMNFLTTVGLSYFMDPSQNAASYSPRFAVPKYPVKLYKVTYQSVIPELNKPTIGTGLIAIPDVDTASLPMISYQHGTVFSRYWVPSIPDSSYETQYMIAQFASQGYVLIGADYFGIRPGTTESNTYFVQKSTEQACLDMYKASLQVLAKENIAMTKFFVNGWSQGAYNTMTFLRRLERENIPVRAAFTAAAPVDPLFFITRGVFNPRSFDAPYFPAGLCNMLFSIEKYNKISGLTTRYIQPQYLDDARKFYNFEKTFDEFYRDVPHALDSVFTPQFFAEGQTVNAPFWRVLGESEAYKWLSPTPLRAYYGMHDEAVPEYIASLAVNYMTTLGKTDAVAINAGQNADHRTTYIESILDAKAWIDSY
ncbi:MAG: hypothetical protein ACKOX3_00515 [Bacteroidota bacterium]